MEDGEDRLVGTSLQGKTGLGACPVEGGSLLAWLASEMLAQYLGAKLDQLL